MLAEIRGLNEECGVFGIWGHEDAAQIKLLWFTCFTASWPRRSWYCR